MKMGECVNRCHYRIVEDNKGAHSYMGHCGQTHRVNTFHLEKIYLYIEYVGIVVLEGGGESAWSFCIDYI